MNRVPMALAVLFMGTFIAQAVEDGLLAMAIFVGSVGLSGIVLASGFLTRAESSAGGSGDPDGWGFDGGDCGGDSGGD